MMSSYVTVDLGATSGRVVVGRLERGQLDVAEVHRFPNEPVGSGREQHWDAEELFAQTVIGLQRAATQVDGAAGGRCDSVGRGRRARRQRQQAVGANSALPRCGPGGCTTLAPSS